MERKSRKKAFLTTHPFWLSIGIIHAASSVHLGFQIPTSTSVSPGRDYFVMNAWRLLSTQVSLGLWGNGCGYNRETASYLTTGMCPTKLTLFISGELHMVSVTQEYFPFLFLHPQWPYTEQEFCQHCSFRIAKGITDYQLASCVQKWWGLTLPWGKPAVKAGGLQGSRLGKAHSTE